MKRAKQISESIELGILLALAGGFMDAYSYIQRDHVFANAQTGNLLLCGIHLSLGEFSETTRYFLPVIFFVLGIALAEIIRLYCKKIFHWRQLAVLIEASILLFVAFLPLQMNLLANSLTSFACGIQVESFRKIHGYGIATTMCIGNLRSGTQCAFLFLQNKKKEELGKSILYFSVIFCFILGAVLGNVCISYFHEKSIIFCSLILFIIMIIMFIDRERECP